MGVLGVFAPLAGAEHSGTSGNGVTPTYIAGNPMCPDDSELWRIDGVPEKDETESGTFEGADWTITITDASNTSFSWTVEGISIGTVIVKAGNGGFVYTYIPGEETGDTNMQSPHSKHNDPGQPQATISHVSFCVGSELPDTGILRVEKAVDDNVEDDYDTSELEFEFDVECTLGEEEPILFEDQVVTPTTPWESPAIPTGYSCEVTEDETNMPSPGTDAHWGTPSYTGNPATIGDDTTVTVKINNVRDEDARLGDLYLRKTTSGSDSTPPSGPYTFTVDCGRDNDPATVNITLGTTSQPVQIADDLPVGRQCDIEETEDQDAVSTSWSVTPSTWGTGQNDTTASVTVPDGGGDGTVTFNNVFNQSSTVIITEDTTTTTTTTTTVPAEVLGEEVTTTTAAPAVAPAVAEAPAPTVAGVVLARTGSETSSLLVLAGVALALGGLLMSASDKAASRRLRREHA
jgi:hypothetical protein